MAPKMSKPAGYGGDDMDDATRELVALLMNMDLNDLENIPQQVSASSTETLEQIQSRFNSQKDDLSKRASLIGKVLNLRKKESATFTKVLMVTVVTSSGRFVMTVSYDEGTTVGTLRYKIIELLNRILKRKSLKILPKALARKLTISFNGVDKSENARATVKTQDLTNTVVTFPIDAPTFQHPSPEDLGVIIDDEDGESEEGANIEDIDDVIPDKP